MVHTRCVRGFGVRLWKEIRRGFKELSLRTSIVVRNGREPTFGWINGLGSNV